LRLAALVAKASVRRQLRATGADFRHDFSLTRSAALAMDGLDGPLQPIAANHDADGEFA
jgi:hypothetical protein